MREHAGQILKITCLILAALVVYQLAGIFVRINPFHGVTVPALPSLAAGTNSLSDIHHGTSPAASAALDERTRSAQRPVRTNVLPFTIIAGTNSTAHGELAKPETNLVSRLETKMCGTNSIPATASANKGTNLLISTVVAGTSAVPHPQSEKMGADSIPAPVMTIAGMNSNPFLAPGKHGDDLPPAIQARISRISDSEILGPAMRPLPMALLGIAGDVAFLRTAGGQTGLVKEGDSLGDIKLLRIGINRVLIEQDGQKKELTIFSGYGGEGLLTPKKETPHETNNQ